MRTRPRRLFGAVGLSDHPCGGLISPVDGGLRLVSLIGGDGHYPPVDEAGFLQFARSLRRPAFYEAIAGAEPLTPIVGQRATEDRLRHYDRFPSRRHLRDGLGPGRRRGRWTARPRRRGPPHRGRLHHADDHLGQHERTLRDDRRVRRASDRLRLSGRRRGTRGSPRDGRGRLSARGSARPGDLRPDVRDSRLLPFGPSRKENDHE